MIHKRRLARLRSQSPDLFCTSSNDAHENGVLGNYSLQGACSSRRTWRKCDFWGTSLGFGKHLPLCNAPDDGEPADPASFILA